MMKALVYGGPGQRSWESVPLPDLKDPDDAIVRVDAVTICGTDLHILKGDVPEVEQGRILGHEAVGTVVEIGSGVRNLTVGTRVLVSCISACGRCRYCRTGSYGQCRGGGGWILGHLIDGTQAEFVRVPFAETSLYKLPDAVADEDALMLADIVPTSYEVGVLNGRVSGRHRCSRGSGTHRPGCHHRRPPVQPGPRRRGRPGRQPAGGGQPFWRRCHRPTRRRIPC